jgi:hypothetical protein
MSTKQRRIVETDELIVQRNFDQRNRKPRTCGTKIRHVRVCGGSGWVTARFYPATLRGNAEWQPPFLAGRWTMQGYRLSAVI